MPSATDNTRLPGIDVSHYQGSVDWPRVGDTGIRFAFAKATEGVTCVDKQFARNASGATSAGLRIGAYHTFFFDDDPSAQVAHLLSVAPLQSGMLPHAVDIKAVPKGQRDKFQTAVQDWLEAYQSENGCTPAIYANLST